MSTQLEFKAIRLFKDRGDFDAHGKRNMWFILPSIPLRNLLIRQLQRKYPELNYVVEWKDVQGFGLQIAHCDWVTPGTTYYCPN